MSIQEIKQLRNKIDRVLGTLSKRDNESKDYFWEKALGSINGSFSQLDTDDKLENELLELTRALNECETEALQFQL